MENTHEAIISEEVFQKVQELIASRRRRQAGLDAALHQPFDLILLDVMLPGIDGFAICKQERAEKDIPILMVTARGEDVDKIRGLGFGADDYIEKPFSPSVLVARVKAHLAQYARLKPCADTPKTITVGPLTADPAARRITKNGVEVPLKNKEYELLFFLMRHPEQVFSREDLYELIWPSAISFNSCLYRSILFF